MLQIALAPSPVASGEVDQRGRTFLEGPSEIRQHIDGVSGAADQRRLDEVVAEDVSAERGLAREVRQSAMIGEGARADDGVVTPIVAVAPHPGAEARGDDGAGDP